MQLKRLFLSYILSLLMLAVSAQALNQSYLDYIDKYKYMAVEQMLRHKIPASITLAQGILESGAGKSRLAIEANNHFGIKCGGVWDGPYILVNDDAPNEKFRKYRSVRESYEDHSDFLKKPRYASLFRLSQKDYKGWAHGLKKCGYATNPQYAYLLINLIEAYDLTQYDKYRSLKGLSDGSQFSSDKLVTIIQNNHTVYRNNDNYYVVAKQGDTFEDIARETEVSPRRLRKYNELPKDYVLKAGDIVYLEKKKRKGHISLKRTPHIIKPGESMYDIAQKYGIRLSSLYKINDLPDDYAAKPNDIIWLR